MLKMEILTNSAFSGTLTIFTNICLLALASCCLMSYLMSQGITDSDSDVDVCNKFHSNSIFNILGSPIAVHPLGAILDQSSTLMKCTTNPTIPRAMQLAGHLTQEVTLKTQFKTADNYEQHFNRIS